MRPLHAFAGGLILITIDFRTVAVDLLPDLVGWLLLAWAGHRLAVPAIRNIAIVGAVASAAVFSLPYHLVQYNPMTDETVVITPGNDLGYAETIAFDPLTGWRLLGFTIGVMALVVAVVLVVRHLATRAAGWHGPSVQRSVRRIRLLSWAVVGLWAAPRLVAVAISGADGYDPIWRDPASRIALVGIVAVVSFAVALLVDAREPWAGEPRRAPVGEPVT